jgi:hypothetical protein
MSPKVKKILIGAGVVVGGVVIYRVVSSRKASPPKDQAAPPADQAPPPADQVAQATMLPPAQRMAQIMRGMRVNLSGVEAYGSLSGINNYGSLGRK